MEKQEFTFSELIMQLANDPDISDDPKERFETAIGIMVTLSGLTM